MDEDKAVHATALAISGIGIVIEGAPGSGKSRLAMALLERASALADMRLLPADAPINAPTRPPSRPAPDWSGLIGDDHVHLSVNAGVLVAAPAMDLRGAIEVRGLGIADVTWCEHHRVDLWVSLVPPGAWQRVPEHASAEIAGATVPRLTLPIVDLAHQLLLIDLGLRCRLGS
ncbi:MAG: hypothetical protein AAF739_15650 [Pseudomonadota bacterium]